MRLDKIWEHQPGKYFFICSKTRSKRWEEHVFSRKQFKQIPEFIKQHMDRDLYFCPHGFNEPRRLKSNAAKTTLLWADLDESKPSECTPMPSVAWQSSPKRYAALWYVDDTTNEMLNQRLTHHLHADPGGWDLTQVLRIPGTRNYKYADAPKVRLLWDDGPIHNLQSIEKLLPQKAGGSLLDLARDALKIFKRYEKQLTPFARRNLLKGRPEQGKRSEVLWKLTNEIIEAGVTADECLILLRASPWNKFRGRADEEAQLQREIDKSQGRKMQGAPVKPAEDEDEEEDEAFIVCMADVEEREIDWLWYPYFARGEITLMEGDPGGGKSYLAQMISAHLCDGRPLPQFRPDSPNVPVGRALYFTMENTAATIAKPRLRDNGLVNMQNFFQGEKFFTMGELDEDKVMGWLEKVKPDLVVFDPINTYLGKADTNNSKEVQQALSIFKDIAQRFNCAVGLIRHLTKSTKEKALYRGQGSIAFIGVARVCVTVAMHPDQPGIRVMASNKTNITGAARALTFTIEGTPKPKRPDASKFVFGEYCDLTSDELLSAAPVKQDSTAGLESFLRDFLRTPKPAHLVESNAVARGFQPSVLQKVAGVLGVDVKDGTWTLQPPAEVLSSDGDTLEIRFGKKRGLRRAMA